MNKITVDLEMFLEIKYEDCLNYKRYSVIERKVQAYAKYFFIKHGKRKDLKNLSFLEKYLKHVLIKISTDEVWINESTQHKLDQRYLYIVIWKYLYLA